MNIDLAKIRFAATVTLGLLVLSDCAPKKSNDKESGLQASVTSSSDQTLITVPFIAPAHLVSFDQQSVLDAIAGYESNFIANSPATAPDTESAFGLCYQKQLDSLEVQANDTTIKVGGEIDISECFKAFFEASGATVESIKTTIALKYEVHCSSGGTAMYQGKKFSDAGRLNFICASGISKDFAILVGKSAFKISGGERTVEVDMQTDDYFGMADGSPCEQVSDGDIWSLKDGCMAIVRNSYSKYSISGEADALTPRDTYFTSTSEAVTRKNEETSLWYLSGSFKVQLNDWAGEVKNRGADLAPTYELKKGSLLAQGDFEHIDVQANLFQQKSLTQQLKLLKDVQLHLKQK